MADRVKYGLSQEALDVYIRYDSESQAVTATSGHSKDDKNIIQLALTKYTVLHPPYIGGGIFFKCPEMTFRFFQIKYPFRTVISDAKCIFC